MKNAASFRFGMIAFASAQQWRNGSTARAEDFPSKWAGVGAKISLALGFETPLAKKCEIFKVGPPSIFAYRFRRGGVVVVGDWLIVGPLS
jgi:hypothetical protein